MTSLHTSKQFKILLLAGDELVSVALPEIELQFPGIDLDLIGNLNHFVTGDALRQIAELDFFRGHSPEIFI